MKSIIILAINFLLVIGASAQYDQFTVRVDGLGCPFCAYGLEKKFKEVDEIKDIEVKLQEGIMTYQVAASNQMTFDQVVKLVDDAGYTAVYVEVKRADGTFERFDSGEKNSGHSEAQMMESVIRVLGNCGMCKDRIEKAAMSVQGVVKADWNETNQELSLEFDASKTAVDEIHKAVAAVGHDTDVVKAPNRVYNRLHQCCKYQREQ